MKAPKFPLVRTGDACIPSMRGYPKCDRCASPYQWRWAVSITQGEMWAWFKGCKCKGAGIEFVKMPARKPRAVKKQQPKG